MPSYRLIKAERGRDCEIRLWGRDADGFKREFVVSHFQPYFYAPAKEGVKSAAIVDTEPGYVSCFGDKLQKIYACNPSEVPNLRDKFSKTWEADIPYGRRFLISRQITSGFDDNLIPCEPPPIRPVVYFLDLEMDARDQMPDPEKDPITCATITCSTGEYVSLLLDDISSTTQPEPNWAVLHLRRETSIIRTLNELLSYADVVSGWNIPWDLEYLEKRAKVIGVPWQLEGVCEFDLLPMYRSLYRRRSYRLKDVVQDEGLTDQDEESVNYGKLWREDKLALLERNRRHCQWVSQIDSKLRIIEYAWELRELAGLEDLEEVIHPSVLIDTMLLRRTSAPLPTKIRHERERFEGAMVLKPPAAVLESIAFFDVSRFYPRILINEKLCPLILHAFRSEASPFDTHVDWTEYHRFAQSYKGEALLLGLVEELMAERDRLQALGHGGKLPAIKGLLNSAYGVLAYSGFRLFTPAISARVTEVARTVLGQLAEKVKGLGYEAIYADTDSLAVRVPEEKLAEVETQLNSILKELGDYSMKLDYYFTRVAFVGAKKRYAGRSLDGTLHFTGFERVRTDSSNYTRQVQENTLRLILEGKEREVVPYLRQVIEGVRQAKLMDIAVTKSLGQDLDGYEKAPQNYILACRARGLKLKRGDFIRVVPAKNYPYQVAVFQDPSDLPHEVKVDYEEVLRQQVRSKVESFLAIIGVNWSEVLAQQRLALQDGVPNEPSEPPEPRTRTPRIKSMGQQLILGQSDTTSKNDFLEGVPKHLTKGGQNGIPVQALWG